MKRNKKPMVLLVIAMVMVFLYWLVGQRNLNRMMTVDESTKTNQTLPAQAISDSNPQPSAQVVPYKASVQQKLQSLQPALNNWVNQNERPIEFYGKVIDENMKPIPDAGISFSCNQYISDNTFETNAVSDSAGLFSISGLIGSSLGVRVAKNGYYSVAANPSMFDYRATFGSSPFQPDAGNPIIFHLRKKGVGANLISAYLKVPMAREGTMVKVDLLNRSFGESGQSQLQMNQIKPAYEIWKKATAWSFEMQIPDGGFVEENDEFLFQAPRSGYQPVMNFKFEKGQTNWKGHIHQNYYIKFGNPPCYGRLEVETDISWGNAHLTYAINPDGSRNLEPQ